MVEHLVSLDGLADQCSVRKFGWSMFGWEIWLVNVWFANLVGLVGQWLGNLVGLVGQCLVCKFGWFGRFGRSMFGWEIWLVWLDNWESATLISALRTCFNSASVWTLPCVVQITPGFGLISSTRNGYIKT